jgi:hypothetical protein
MQRRATAARKSMPAASSADLRIRARSECNSVFQSPTELLRRSHVVVSGGETDLPRDRA